MKINPAFGGVHTERQQQAQTCRRPKIKINVEQEMLVVVLKIQLDAPVLPTGQAGPTQENAMNYKTKAKEQTDIYAEH